MPIYNIHYAKTQLSRLVEQAAAGEQFIIAKAGRPMVQVTAINPNLTFQKIGFLADKINVPNDIDYLNDEVLTMFEASK